jgi:peptidoglycan hydrolase CwlO-like protein
MRREDLKDRKAARKTRHEKLWGVRKELDQIQGDLKAAKAENKRLGALLQDENAKLRTSVAELSATVLRQSEMRREFNRLIRVEFHTVYDSLGET